jgi:hypothetical protein
MVIDTFVGTPNLEAKAWFFTRPRGGKYITDIRVARITRGNGTSVKREVLEAWRSINRVKKTYTRLQKVSYQIVHRPDCPIRSSSQAPMGINEGFIMSGQGVGSQFALCRRFSFNRGK